MDLPWNSFLAHGVLGSSVGILIVTLVFFMKMTTRQADLIARTATANQALASAVEDLSDKLENIRNRMEDRWGPTRGGKA